MTMNWLRRTAVLAACASAALLTACGSSSVESAFTPTRIVSFGDALSDVRQTGGRFTINDGSTNIWAEQLAVKYGLGLTEVSAGGTGYARGNARVTATPDAAGVVTTLTLTQQIDAFLRADSIREGDMLVVNGGVSDVIAQMAAVTAGSITPDQMVENANAAGRAMAAQVHRLVNAGAKHVVVAGTYDLGRSPWAASIGQTDLLRLASSSSSRGSFNSGLLASLSTLDGRVVLYVDAERHFNLVINSPGNYSLNNIVTPVCTSVDNGNGIGIGAGQVNSALCTLNTLLPGADRDRYAFADAVYFTPVVNRLFGVYAYDQVRQRW